MKQQIREQIAHLQRESRFLRNLAGGILLYSIVTSYFLKVQFLSPLGFLFAVFLYLSARDIYKDADAQQPENWSIIRRLSKKKAKSRGSISCRRSPWAWARVM